MIEFDRGRRRSAEVELTPMIDVVFQLLVFFLLTSNLMAQAIPIELPKAATGEETQTLISVAIAGNDAIYLNGKAATWERLPHRIQALTAGTEAGAVSAVIAADGRIPHATVVGVVDVLRRQGVYRLAFQVTPLDGEPPRAR